MRRFHRARRRLALRLVSALVAGLLLGAGPLMPSPPAAPPQPPDPAVAVPRHLRHVADVLSRTTSHDDIGRHALDEARTSFVAARAAAGRGAFLVADQLAASADDLARAADDPRPPRPRDAPQVLASVDTIVSALANFALVRVKSLVAFAQTVASGARHDAALNEPDAGREAVRAEAIARAAAHVAIAADPSLAPLGPPHPVPPPPPRPPGPAEPHE